MFKIYLILLVFFVANLRVACQIKNVLISDVSNPEEVSIAINPKNTNQIIAGANLASYYFSNNAGLTWERKVLKCDKYNVWGDPVVFWDTLQTAYYMHLSFPNPKITPDGSWVDRIVVNKSVDGGLTYPSCSAFGKNGTKVQDKHWATVNRNTNEIHVTWTQFDKYESSNVKDTSIIRYSKSTDGGETWAEPKKISYYTGDCVDSDNTVEGAVPCVGPKGEVYVAWAGPKGLVFNRSVDNGITWLEKEKILDSIPEGWDYNISGVFRTNGLPFTACDNSNGSYRGRIYICWSDAKFGANNKDVFLTYSDDGGETWMDRILVTYYPNHKQQFMPNFTIDNSNGYLYFIYYDRKNFANGNSTDVTLTVSRDGGKTFTHHTINENTFTPHKSVFFGDYIGISAHNGVIRPIWMQMDGEKKLSIYTALLTDSILKNHASPTSIAFNKSKPYIYSSRTEINFSLQGKEEVSAYLYSATDPAFEVKVFSKKNFSGPNCKFKVNFKNLGLKKGTYVLMLYTKQQSNYVWIQEE